MAVTPLACRSLFVAPHSNPAKQAIAWRTVDPTGARYMEWLAARPTAAWIGDWTTDPRKTVDDLITAAGDRVRVIVVYNIPHRDGSDFSAGGAGDGIEYRTFVTAAAAGIEGRPVIVVLEPDGLAHVKFLTPDQLRARHAMIRLAVETFARAGARVYVDAGDSNWIPADVMATALRAAGIDMAAGFALNVSHFERTVNEHRYAGELRSILGDSAGYVVDTGRNGLGPYEAKDGEDERIEWCNPPGRAVGLDPTLSTYVEGCDAYLWVKPPGDSDGDLNGAPPPGKWFPSYARGLVKRRHVG